MAWFDKQNATFHTHEYPNKRKMEKGVQQAQQHGWQVTQITPMSQGCLVRILVPFASERYVVMFSRSAPPAP